MVSKKISRGGAVAWVTLSAAETRDLLEVEPAIDSCAHQTAGRPFPPMG
jgi:hypothetical protein